MCDVVVPVFLSPCAPVTTNSELSSDGWTGEFKVGRGLRDQALTRVCGMQMNDFKAAFSLFDKGKLKRYE